MRNSILSVETTDTQVDDVEFVDDAAEVEDFVRSHRGGDGASGSGAGRPGDLLLASNNDNNNNACQPRLGAREANVPASATLLLIRICTW